MKKETKKIVAFIHPEAKEDEVFLMNTNNEGFSKITWKTKRMGVFVYDELGSKCEFGDIFPVFIKEKEIKRAEKVVTDRRRQLLDDLIEFFKENPGWE